MNADEIFGKLRLDRASLALLFMLLQIETSIVALEDAIISEEIPGTN